ncbi:MAG TPA: hypothetical protein VJ830_02960 [Anaerolineales bacterium]|nr:hypothetical protein [Anaerolineales bacterium]
MKADKNFQRKPILPMLLTLAGILMGLLLALLAVWADYESTAYGFFRRAQASFGGLVCPVFMGEKESSTVSIKLSNPTDRTISPSVQVEISTPNELDSETEFIQLAPGEQITLQKTIGPRNVDLGMFIFVNAHIFSTYPLPARENTCGILVLPITRGAPLLIAGTVLSTLFMAVGIWILYKNKQFARQSRAILFMVIATTLAMFLGFSGSWLVAGILIILSILTLFITAGSSFT